MATHTITTTGTAVELTNLGSTSAHRDYDVDLESSSPTGPNPPPHPILDPLQLSSALKSPSEIKQIGSTSPRNSTSTTIRSRLPFSARAGPTTTGTNPPQRPRDIKALQAFYESQNAHINLLLKPVSERHNDSSTTTTTTTTTTTDAGSPSPLRVNIAIYGSLTANILLAILQLYAACSSGSLSLFATMADSVFDPLSNLLLILTHRAVKRVDISRFPSGKARLETAGNIGFASLMVAVSLILIVLSVRDFATHDAEKQELKGLHIPSIIAVSIALFSKFVLFLYCWPLRTQYSQIMILWEDHRNDLLVNSFGLVTSIGGSRLAWWVDPLGATLIALLIAILWGRTIYSQTLLLIGVSAPPEVRGLITYLAMTHDERIKAIDTVRCYYAGPRLIVEVDVVMGEEEPLRVCHDVSEGLQVKLEGLPEVERAYVHVDWEVEHRGDAEHGGWKKVL